MLSVNKKRQRARGRLDAHSSDVLSRSRFFLPTSLSTKSVVVRTSRTNFASIHVSDEFHEPVMRTDWDPASPTPGFGNDPRRSSLLGFVSSASRGAPISFFSLASRR
jgi:hypothetical protein